MQQHRGRCTGSMFQAVQMHPAVQTGLSGSPGARVQQALSTQLAAIGEGRRVIHSVTLPSAARHAVCLNRGQAGKGGPAQAAPEAAAERRHPRAATGKSLLMIYTQERTRGPPSSQQVWYLLLGTSNVPRHFLVPQHSYRSEPVRHRSARNGAGQRRTLTTSPWFSDAGKGVRCVGFQASASGAHRWCSRCRGLCWARPCMWSQTLCRGSRCLRRRCCTGLRQYGRIAGGHWSTMELNSALPT